MSFMIFKSKNLINISLLASFIMALSLGTVYADDQNLKDSHAQFRNQPINQVTLSSFHIVPRLSPYQVYAGTIIPGVLVGGMNSDLPGKVIGQVAQNIYDTVSGRYLLIPQGSKLIGEYDTKTAFAQTRGAVVWQRLILPNGDSLLLPNLDGADQQGYVGLKDKVRSHYSRVIWSSLLGAVMIGGLATMSEKANNDSDDNTFAGNMASEMESNLGSAVDRIVSKNLNIAPTVIIRPGYKFNIIVGSDLVLKPYVE